MSLADTSRAAYAAVPLQQREREVMAAIRLRFPAARFTRKELARALGWEINRVTGRVLTLIERGYLTEHTDTRDGGHLLSIARPKTAAPAETPSPTSKEAIEPAAAGPKAAQPSTAMATAASSREDVGPGGLAAAAPGSALEIAQRRAAEAQAHRLAMPGVTAFVDELRRDFPNCRVTYARENGVEVGRRGNEGVPFSDPGPAVETKRRRVA